MHPQPGTVLRPAPARLTVQVEALMAVRHNQQPGGDCPGLAGTALGDRQPRMTITAVMTISGCPLSVRKLTCSPSGRTGTQLAARAVPRSDISRSAAGGAACDLHAVRA